MGVEYKHYLIPEDNTYKPSPEELRRLIDSLLSDGFVARGSTDTIRKMEPDPDSADWDSRRVICYVRNENEEDSWFPCPCSSGDIAALGERDFKLVWSVESSNDSGLKYPLTPFPEWGDAYYELELHLAEDFVHHWSEIIDEFPKMACVCGRELRYKSPSDWTFDANLVESAHSSTLASESEGDKPRRLPLYFPDSRIFRICPTCGRPFRPHEMVARVRDGWTGKASHRSGGCTYLFAVVIDCGKGFAREGWPIRASEEFVDTVTSALGQKFYEIGDIY